MLHVDIPTRADVQSLIQTERPGLISIYLPTSPVTQAAQADRIALKNLTHEAVSQLADFDKKEVRAMEEALLDLVDDDEFWEFQANSLAVFATPDGLQTFRLPNHLQPVVEVSDRFLIKPLLRAITTPQSAFVLALAENSVRLVEVSPSLPARQVKVADMPEDAASAVGKASINDRSPSGRIQGAEGKKIRLAQYARKVDHVLRDLLAGRETPLILAATEPLLSIYRTVQTYPHLAHTTITTNPETLSDGDLAEAARPILDELFQKELAEIAALFAERGNQGRSTNDIAQAAKAATFGAIQKLLVCIDVQMPGTIDENGVVSWSTGASAASHDIIDTIAARAFLTGARVLAVRQADIPGGGELAAVMRYPF